MQGECDSFVSTNFDHCDDAYSSSIRKVKVHALHYANELLVRLRLPFQNILHIVIPRQTEVPATQVNVEVAWLYFQLYFRCLDIPIKHCLSCLLYYLQWNSTQCCLTTYGACHSVKTTKEAKELIVNIYKIFITLQVPLTIYVTLRAESRQSFQAY